MPEDDLDNPEDQQNEGPKALREALKREQQERAAAQAELEQLKREAAFRDAGMDLSNPQHAAMAKGYDGDPAGISEWVGNLGLTSTTNPPPQVEIAERQQLERLANASAGDTPAPAPQAMADKDAEMRAVTEQARRERWDPPRYQDEMVRISQKYGMPVASMQIEQNFGAQR